MNIGLKNQERTIFSPKVFDLSRKFEFDHVETEQGKVIIIDHFYKNFEAVQQEIQKIPICELGTDEEIENRGEKFFIGRRSHVIGMRGTVPPYREMVSRLVYNYFSLDRLNMNAAHTGDFLVNVFRKGPEFPEETHYCFVHRDPVKDAPRSMAIVVFLNSSYENRAKEELNGTGFGIGLGFTPLPLLSLNIETKFIKVNEIDSNSGTIKLPNSNRAEDSINEILLSVSLPFEL